jgi:glycosyltransferase involved in cell wall biosynthesis
MMVTLMKPSRVAAVRGEMSSSPPPRRLKMLFFSQPFVYPADTGGKIRTSQMLRLLREAFDITLVSNVDPRHDLPYLDQMASLCQDFHPVPRTTARKYSAAFYLKVLVYSLSRYPVAVLNDYSRATVATLKRLLADRHYDLLVCDFLQPTLNLRSLRTPPTLLFQHNVESMIWERHYRTSRHPLLRLFWYLQWRKMRRYERQACARVDGIVTVSEFDKQVLERDFGARNVHAIPTGVDTDFFRPGVEPPEDDTLVFLGAMDWLPNEDGILFFADDVLPRLRKLVPSVRLTIVGRNPTARLLERTRIHPEIRVMGRVDDVRPHVARGAVFVIPLRIGGGTRIKAYEAMAMGKAVVSTRIGIEGLPVRDGDNVVLADSPDDFAAAVARLLKDKAERERIEKNARAYVEANVSWRRAADAFATACVEVARG